MSNNEGLATYGRPADEKYLSIAPAGTAVPTSATAALAAAFQTVKVSADGTTDEYSLGKGDPLKDWAGKSQIDAPSDPSETVEVPILSNTEAAFKIVYGSGNVTADSDGMPTAWSFDGTTDEWVIVRDELWNAADGKPTDLVRTVYPRAVPYEIAAVGHTRTDGLVYDTTFQCLTDSNGKYSYGYRAHAADADES